MQLIAITKSSYFEEEAQQIQDLFEAGLDILHIRKKNTSKRKLVKLLNAIPEKYHGRIVLHLHHGLALKYALLGIHLTRRHKKHRFKTFLKCWYFKFKKSDVIITTSFHGLDELRKKDNTYTYVFLSPVFDSVSKKGYLTPFNSNALKKQLTMTSYRVIALGGVTENNINRALQMGFSGAAVLGYLWNGSFSPVAKFNTLLDSIGVGAHTNEGSNHPSSGSNIRPIKISFNN